MLLYCLQRKKKKTKETKKKKKKTESKNTKVVNKKNRKIMLWSECAVCDNKKPRFIKKETANGLLTSIGIKTPLSQIPSVGLRLL